LNYELISSVVDESNKKPIPDNGVSAGGHSQPSGEHSASGSKSGHQDVGKSSSQASKWELLTRNMMRCEQCGRERKLNVARTNRFCAQRCIVDWLRDNPEKTPKDAVGDSKAPLFSLPSLTPTNTFKPAKPPKAALSRVLKNLEIDMAPPGATLQLSDSEQADEESDSTPPRKTHFTEPATAPAKRSNVFSHPSAIKKSKLHVANAPSTSPAHSSKTVSFDMTSAVGSTYSTSSKTSGLSIVPLDRLTQLLKNSSNKTPQVKPNIKIPKG